ncbi:MAG: hypothetical protein GXO24_03805 [Chlorobi bacterium]|nr:hypothetical protein [Chlorobiota bacterium]
MEKLKRIPHIDLLLFGFLALIYWGLNGHITLWDQDEAAYAGFAKYMLDKGNSVIPYYYWSEIHRKPPLHVWFIALAYKMFGINTFAVRFFSALWVWLSVLLIRIKGARYLGVKYARMAALFMAGNVFVLILGKTGLTDGMMLFLYTLAGLSLTEYFTEGRRRSLIPFYVALALGMLVKGPPIVLWAGFWWLLLWLFYPEKKTVVRMHPWIWGVAALIPFGIWIYKAWKLDPEFVKWWWDWYIMRRTHEAVINQTGPPGYYFILFFLFALPFLPLVFLAFRYVVKNLRSKNPLLILWILWLVAGWIPYEFLPSKLPSYALASYPALALLAGLAMKEFDFGDIKVLRNLRRVHLLLLGLAATGVVLLMIKWVPVPSRLFGLSVLLLALILAAWAIAWISKRHMGSHRYFSLYLSAGLIWTATIGLVIFPLLDPLKNTTYRTAQAAAELQPEARKTVLLNSKGQPPSLPFYVQQFIPRTAIIKPDRKQMQFLDKHINEYRQSIWIISPEQWAHMSDTIPIEDFRIIKGFNLGNLQQNTYIVVKPAYRPKPDKSRRKANKKTAASGKSAKRRIKKK